MCSAQCDKTAKPGPIRAIIAYEETAVPRLAPAAVAIAALIAIFMGAMYLRFSGNRILPPNLHSSSEGAQLSATDRHWDDPSRVGGGPFIVDPIEATLSQIHYSSPCNQPDPSTARATRSTWDTAHSIVHARGGFISKSCEPGCLPDDHTKVWLVEVQGTFVLPEGTYAGAMVRDTGRQASPTRPAPGTWFEIIPVLNY